MSGIYGFIKIGDDERAAGARTGGLRHWNRDYGRNGEGELTGKGFAIGNFVEHFSETFPAGSPVFEDGDLLYAIDAVIYNRDELDAAEGESDEELIIRLIKSKGYSELRNVNGDFAGAVFDRGKRELRLFRDHLGVRQLYYYLKNGLFAFSTDIRGIGAIPDADLKEDESQLWLNLAGYYSESPDKTDFEYIRCVLPGSVMTFAENGGSFSASTEKYFVPGRNRIRLENDEQYIEEMRRLVEDAIRRRLDAFPGRIGAELSGGMDSSVIDVYINRMRPGGKYIAWYSIPDDIPALPEDERPVIRDIVEREKLDLVYLSDRRTAEDNTDRVVPVFANTAQIGRTAEVAAENGIRVVFSGQGGDEGVSHRANCLELFRAREYRHFLKEVWHSTEGKNARALRFVYYLAVKLFFEYPKKLRPWRSEVNAVPILNGAFAGRMKSIRGGPLYFSIDPALDFKCGGIRLRPETAAYQAAQYGVRYVFPYEDYRLFDYALSIPRNLFRRDGVNRWIYRKAFEDVMPESLLSIYKGVSAPNFSSDSNRYSEAMRLIMDRLDRDRWSGFLDYDRIEERIRSGEPDDEEAREHFFALIVGMSRFVLIQDFQDRCRL